MNIFFIQMLERIKTRHFLFAYRYTMLTLHIHFLTKMHLLPMYTNTAQHVYYTHCLHTFTKGHIFYYTHCLHTFIKGIFSIYAHVHPYLFMWTCVQFLYIRYIIQNILVGKLCMHRFYE